MPEISTVLPEPTSGSPTGAPASSCTISPLAFVFTKVPVALAMVRGSLESVFLRVALAVFSVAAALPSYSFV